MGYFRFAVCFNMKYLDARSVTGVRKEKVISSRAESYYYLLYNVLRCSW